jgi:hypothetical protein
MQRSPSAALAVAVVVACAASAAPAVAAPVTYYFGGSFATAFGGAPAGITGTAFSGTLTYDPAAPVSSSTANSVVYAPGSGSLSVQSLFGSGAIDAGAGQVGSKWDAAIASQLGGLYSPADEMAIGGSATYAGSLSPFQVLGLQLLDGTGGAADDPFGVPLSALPNVLDLGQFDSASITLFAAGIVDGVFQTTASAVGRIDCLSTDAGACPTVTNVPEPASLSLIGAGLLAFALARARRPAGLG